MAFENLEPKEVFHFFEEICHIPHGSGNVQKISDYLVSFAKDRGLEVIQDEKLNVIIKAPGSAGYEDKEPVILQGHMDMVAVKEEGADIDMKKDGLKTATDGEFVWADSTSLGGDDGIAVAYCLALLDSKEIPHPPLEVVITTDEETGMFGATAIDLSSLKGRKMINIDNEEEGVFITSCAGGARVYSELLVGKKRITGSKATVKVSGLLGGHSGEMIIKGRGNANIILARVLLEAMDCADFSLVNIKGGVADNAIPSDAEAVVMVEDGDLESFIYSIKASTNDILGELEIKDPGLKVTINGSDLSNEQSIKALLDSQEEKELAVITEDTKKVLSLICTLPDGVQAMSASVEGLVETSLNLGIMKMEDSRIILEQSVRSSVESSKEFLIRRLTRLARSFGAVVTVSGAYPGWKYKEKSELRDHMVRVYEEM